MKPEYVNTLRVGNGMSVLDQTARAESAWIAAIRTVDETPDFFAASTPLSVNLDFDALDVNARTARLGDAELRRYIARRVYLLWSQEGFDRYLEFDNRDLGITGNAARDFRRNVQVLEQEGYVQLERTFDDGLRGFSARATAQLVRDVERYGAARPDVESDSDYLARVTTLSALQDIAEHIAFERTRYQAFRFSSLVPLFGGA